MFIFSVLPKTLKKLLRQYIITEKNKPIAILNVDPDKCFILNIIKEENKLINNRKIGYVINFNS